MDILNLFSVSDAFRREERFNKFLLTCQATTTSKAAEFPAQKIEAAYQATKQVNVTAWLTQEMKGPEIAEKLKANRLTALEEWLKKRSL